MVALRQVQAVPPAHDLIAKLLLRQRRRPGGSVDPGAHPRLVRAQVSIAQDQLDHGAALRLVLDVGQRLQLAGVLANHRVHGESLDKVRERLDQQTVKPQVAVDGGALHAERIAGRSLPPVYVLQIATRIFGLVFQRLFGANFTLADGIPARLDCELLLFEIAMLPGDAGLCRQHQRGGELGPLDRRQRAAVQVLARLQVGQVLGLARNLDRPHRDALDPRPDQPVHAGHQAPRLVRVLRLRNHLDRIALAIDRHQAAQRRGLVLVQEADAVAFVHQVRRKLEQLRAGKQALIVHFAPSDRRCAASTGRLRSAPD